jgi:hypothetical protein
MAFGKKKDDAPGAPSDAAEALAEDIDETPDVEDEAATAENDAAPGTEEPAVAADPLAGGEGGGAELLSMFQTTQIEGEDRSSLLELAGEVELADLLEELHTVRAAIAAR